MNDFSWDPSYNKPILALGSLAVGFLIYLVLLLSRGIQRRLDEKYGSEMASYYLFLINKWGGFFLLGLLPFVLIPLVLGDNPLDYGLGKIENVATWYWIFGLGGLLFVLLYLVGTGPGQQAIYPLIRIKEWSPRLLTIDLVSGAAFMLGYEYMFRGVLLWALVPYMGAWPAIAVIVVIYSFAHIHKGLGETLGSIPFGILLCYITLSTGNIWAVFVIHCVLALGTDMLTFSKNPEMRVVWKKG